MHTREAVLPDAERIHDLIGSYSTDGTLLPRTLAEICENVRDFIVLEEAGQVVGCGALHLYGRKGVLALLEEDGYRVSRVY